MEIEKFRSKRGRGAPGKTPFMAAVPIGREGRSRKATLAPVKGFRQREAAQSVGGPPTSSS